MTKRNEPIPFMGIVEIEDDESVYPMTQQEVANVLNTNRPEVSRIQKQAMQKFKEKFLKKFNKDDFI
jgi:predicted XRE-type DNA-binding protein